MKRTGMIRRVDDLGRIVIPKEIRRSMYIKDGTPMEIFISEEGIVLKKHYIQGGLPEMLCAVENVLQEMEVELGKEKSEGIKQNISSIRQILEQD